MQLVRDDVGRSASRKIICHMALKNRGDAIL